ncbi:hypothetical protein PMAYCL1PPCAC_25229, partial [Pristionchus mayeri]
CNPKYEIGENITLLECLLTIADRFDIKVIIDRVEQILVNSQSFSAAKMLRFSDNHDSFRFTNMQIKAFSWIESDLSFSWENPRSDLLVS